MEEPKDWLIWDAKDRLWWKAEGLGYTRRASDAGRFTERDAIGQEIRSALSLDRHDVAIPLASVTG